MLTWVVYDISKDRTRTKIADRCLDFGLQRVQKSVFLGEIPPNRVEEILQFSRDLLNLETDAVYVFPMCRDDFDLGRERDGKPDLANGHNARRARCPSRQARRIDLGSCRPMR